MASITYQGERNFAVWSIDDQLTRLGLLVNEIGSYSGTVLVQASTFQGTASVLQVEADGPWTITLNPESAARTFDTSVEGTGDDVVSYTGTPKPAAISHDGSGNLP